MDYDIFRQLRLQDLVPADHLLAMLLQNLQQACVEVSLQRVIVLDPLLLHVSLDRRIAVPLLTFVLVAADVQVVVRKERRHLAQKRLEKFVDLFARRIEGGLEYTRPPFNGVWTRCATELRITNEPTGAVTGYIKLRHDANAAIAGIRDDLFDLFLRIVVAVRSKLVQLW